MQLEITAQHAATGTTAEATLNRLAGAIRSLARQRATGDLAALRRLDPDKPDAGAFFRVLASATRGPATDLDSLPRWALAAWAFAQAVASGPEKLGGDSLGRALANAEVSEARVNRLLAARDGAFRYQMQRMVRILAGAGERLPVLDLGLLVLADSRDEKLAEHLRRKIARDYWHTRPRKAAAPDIDTTGGDDT